MHFKNKKEKEGVKMCNCREENKCEYIVELKEKKITFELFFIHCIYCNGVSGYKIKAKESIEKVK